MILILKEIGSLRKEALEDVGDFIARDRRLKTIKHVNVLVLLSKMEV